jgi:excisionase family DNA binding protein
VPCRKKGAAGATKAAVMELTIAEAATALGVSVDTVRRRIRRGDLRARRDEHGRYLITLEMDSAETPAAKRARGAEAETERELTHTREVLAEVRRQRDQLEQQVAALQEQISAAATERSELRQLLAMHMRAAQLPAPAGEESASADVASQTKEEGAMVGAAPGAGAATQTNEPADGPQRSATPPNRWGWLSRLLGR